MIRSELHRRRCFFHGLVIPTYFDVVVGEIVGRNPLSGIGLLEELVGIDEFAELTCHGGEVVSRNVEALLFAHLLAEFIGAALVMDRLVPLG